MAIVSIGRFKKPDAAHICRNSQFKDETALAVYHEYPLQLAVKPLVTICRILRHSAISIDYWT
ncbi:MAG TPA: hypothetical protein ENN02_02675 [Halothiobacillus sp.]|nr:hypothetical protein [Halothiobacillus sp.]